MPDVPQAAPGAGDYLDQLARFVGLTPEEDIPEAVLARTREILLDSFPVLACGMRTPELVALSDKLPAEVKALVEALHHKPAGRSHAQWHCRCLA